MGAQSRPPRSGGTATRSIVAALVSTMALLAMSAAAPADPRPPTDFAEINPEPPSRSAEEPIPTATDGEGAEFVVKEVVVKFEDSATQAQRTQAIDSVGSDSSRPVEGVPGARVIELGPGDTVVTAVEQLEQRGAVEFAEPNFIFRAMALPNDPFLDELWGLRNFGQVTWPGTPDFPTVEYGTPGMDINVEKAWNLVTGSEDVNVAVIDSGIDASPQDVHDWGDTRHPDLKTNINEELSINYADNPITPQFPLQPDDWWDSHGHGSHVAGTIGAQGNNGVGVTGVNWNVGLVAVRVLNIYGEATSEQVASGAAYAGDQGIRIANMSLGAEEGEMNLDLVGEAIEDHPNTLYIVAAGNGGDDEVGDDIDVTPTYPCGYDLENTLCVSALASDGSLADFSDYGDQRVELGAPGQDILSTMWYLHDDPDSGYWIASGTSMAAPHVSGVAALVQQVRPNISAARLKQVLMETAKPTASLAGKTVTGGRVDAYAAVKAVLPSAKCELPDGTVYRTHYRAMPNTTFDIFDIDKKGASSSTFTQFNDFWGDVAKLEWWTANTLNEAFTQPGAWGNPLATNVTNAWDYAHWYGAVDQRPDILATNPFTFLSPRVSFRTNGSGLVRDADVCDTFLGDWPEYTGSASGKRTAIVGDSMTVQMAKKLLNTTGWRLRVEPQAKSSFATMKGEIRGLASGLRETVFGLDEQTPPQVLVMALGTKDADHIAAGATQADRDARLTGFGWNLAGMLMETTEVQCRILVTTHETGWKPDGTYSAPLKEARQDVNAQLRSAAAGSATIDIVDWGQMSASHGAHTPVGTRWYEPTDRENPNAAGLTALSNAIIAKAKGNCS